MNKIRAKAVIQIPATEMVSGDSVGISIQLKIAPKTGIINFQIFRSETFTPSRCKSENQMERAVADNKLNQPSEK